MPLPRWLARFNLHVTKSDPQPTGEKPAGMGGIIAHSRGKTRREYHTPRTP
jgi:hypothetical protein